MKKLKSLRITGLLSLVLGIVSFFMGFIAWLGAWYTVEVSSAVGIWFLFSIVIGIIALIMSFINSIFVLAIDFENKDVNDSRILWGILSLFLLGSIGVIIFVSINLKYFSVSEDETNNKEAVDQESVPKESVETEEKSSQPKNGQDNVETITKAFKLFEDGIITKEEFEQMKAQTLKQ